MKLAERRGRRWRWRPTLAVLPTVLLPVREGRVRRLGYALLSIPLGMVYVSLFAGLVVAVVFAVQVVGILLFLVVLAFARGLGGLERRLTRRMLLVEVEDGVRLRRQAGRVVHRLRGLLTASSTWRTIAWLGARVLFAAGVVATVLFWMGAVVWLFGYPDWLAARTLLLDVLMFSLCTVLAVVLVRALDFEVRIIASVAPVLLGVSAQERIEALRQTSLRLAERNSVARDLHDTIGHTLTASLLQATAARRTLTPDPDEPGRPVDSAFARQALAHIEDNTRAALAELDRALAVLGDRRGTTNAGPSDLEVPDLTDIEGLVVGLRDGGLPLTLAVDVSPHEVPAPVSQLAYRIIQEGTTNVLRHAGCPPTLAEVIARGDQLLVRIHNAPAGGRTGPRPGPGGSHGISGLSERTVAVGGRLTAGPSPQGGFELSAVLPLRGAHV